MSTTGERIRELRLRHNLTLDDVARHLGVGRQAIYKYEQGTVTNIPLENLEKMAQLFGTTPGYLAGWTETHPPEQPIQNPNVYIPHTPQARSLARGMDRMPESQRNALMQMLNGLCPGIFENEGDDTSES